MALIRTFTITVAVLLLASLAAAATDGELTGTWYTTLLHESGDSVWVFLSFAEDSAFTANYYDDYSYRVAWSSGHYTVENSLLTLEVTGRSEQFCLGGTCQAFEGASAEVARLAYQGAGMFIAIPQNDGAGEAQEILYRLAGPEIESLGAGIPEDWEPEPERFCAYPYPAAGMYRCRPDETPLPDWSQDW